MSRGFLLERALVRVQQQRPEMRPVRMKRLCGRGAQPIRQAIERLMYKKVLQGRYTVCQLASYVSLTLFHYVWPYTQQAFGKADHSLFCLSRGMTLVHIPACISCTVKNLHIWPLCIIAQARPFAYNCTPCNETGFQVFCRSWELR